MANATLLTGKRLYIWATLWQKKQQQKKTKNKTTCAPAQEPSLYDMLVAKDPRFLQADSEHSDQTGRMLIRLGGCPGWSESLLCPQILLLVSTYIGSYWNDA